MLIPLYSDRNWTTVEETLTSDMALIAGYLKTWRLKLSVAKTTSTAFHLNTKEARRKLTVNVNGSPLPHNPTPTYLGVKLDRQLTYKQHLDSLRAKVSSRNNLLRRLAGSSWGASPSTLRTGALALVYSAAEYASPAWSRSAHAKKIRHHPQRDHEDCHRLPETHSNGVSPGIIWHCTSCPTQRKLHIQTCEQGLAGPEPSPTQTCIGLKISVANACPPAARSPATQHPLVAPISTRFKHGEPAGSRLPDPPPPQLSVTPNTSLPPGADLPRKDWATLNRLRTGVGRFNANIHRWGLRPSAACPCGAEEQTAHHIIHEWPTFPPPNDLDLENLNPDTVSWLQRLSDTA